MRISADCIDEEVDQNKDQQLSDQFSRMALNENKTAEDIRVIYKVNYSSLDSSVSLSVIPVTDHYRNGYQSNWDEIKQQVLDLSFKDKSKVSNNLQFVGRIDSSGYEMELTNQDEYYTALKVAEMCGQPLDVMIKNDVKNNTNQPNKTIQSTASASKESAANEKIISKRFSSDSDNDPTDDRNGFVLLDSTKTKETATKADSSTQFSVGENMIVINESQIEKIKKEITIDVTKRLISKLNECLIDLTNESAVPPSAPNQEVTNGNGADSRPHSMTAPMPKVVHRGIICDNCDLQIEGIRYKCVNCFDFDLCEKCKQMPSVHDSTHSFNTIERYIRGIPKQNYAPNLDFLKPFLSVATVDPKSRDVFLSLDVDLNNGTISSSNVSQTNPMPSTSMTKTNEKQTKSAADQTGPSKPESVEEEPNPNVSSQSHQRKYHPISDRKANKINKKLEKLKLKSQMYNNLLQTNEERSSPSIYERPRPQPSAPYMMNQALNSNKTLYLSGLIVGDETIPEGTRMPPNTKFRKTWKVRNTGTKVWTGRTTLRFVWGHSELEPFGRVTEVQAPTLRPGEEGKVTIRFTSPNPTTVTRYQSYWRLHHRGQQFGQRLIVKIIVDPSATTITPTPTPMAPILSKDSRNTTLPLTASVRLPRSQYFVPPSITGNTYAINGTNCNLDAMANIHQSILDSQRTLSDRLKAMAAVNRQYTAFHQKEKTQKTSAKKLTEALSQVKEIRFNLDENESIPMKSNVKSHTTTPANTPFDVSPPKSPEPNTVSNNFSQIESNEKNDKNDGNNRNEDKTSEEKDNESDCESLDVLSLSSGGNESSDEFVLVPFPSCFDLNVPFVGVDNQGFEDSTTEALAQNKENDNCFEVIEKNKTKDEELVESDDSNDLSDDNTLSANEPTDERPLDLTKDRQQCDGVSAQLPPIESTNKNSDESESEPQVRPKNLNASTNPFRNNSNETENVIHVLPESIVTGALSAAAHVYNNGNNFAWVTSPPPAALPLPDMYWDNRSNQYVTEMPPPAYHVIGSTAPNAPIYTSDASSQRSEAPTRLTCAMKQLYEMGFWNQKLNQELLEKNELDVNYTIEELLSPSKRQEQTTVTTRATEEPVVSHQPRNKNGFIDEFD